MNENKRVYICDIDYLYTKESPEFEQFEGGAVYVFVYAFDVRNVLDQLLPDFMNKKLEAREIVSITPYDLNQEWDTADVQEHYLLLYKECETLEQIVYDDFIAYEKSE